MYSGGTEATVPTPNGVEFGPHHITYFLTIIFNINLPSTPRSSKWPLSFSSGLKFSTYAFVISPMGTRCPVHPIVFDLTILIFDEADHSDRAVWSMNCLRSLESWDRGFESRSRHGCLCVCVRLFCVCICPVCRQRPCDGVITRPRSPTVCVKKITKLKRPGPNKRAVQRLMNEIFDEEYNLCGFSLWNFLQLPYLSL
jgi:hypothetical protein